MQTHVYANDQEIACKAAGQDGVSPQAFPDPCWSPPGPTAGPIVIPYPNTCFAESITNGTSTIRICGKESAIEDHSYFATSTGNEPATEAFGKGVATKVITGKAYFTQWSFDVVFEGFGVPRHTDLVSHNHGSMPSNTPVFPYVSRGWFGHDCNKEQDRIERACKPEKDDSDAKKEIKGKSKLAALLKARRGKRTRGRRDKDGWHWTDDHCDGLSVAVTDGSTGIEYAKQMQEAYESLPNELNILGALKSQLQEMVVDAAGTAATKWVAKAAIKQGVGTALPVAGNVVMGVWSVVDGAMSIGDVREIKAVATESLEKLDVLKEKLSDLKKASSDYANFDKLSPKEQLDKARGLASEGQDILATLNDCTRARKCNLVPYSADGVGNTFRRRDSKNPSKVESSSGGGCCGGQTGHHLIPSSSITKEVCPNYDFRDAPTVCVEGTSQSVGSHKRAHTELAEAHSALEQNGKVAADGSMSMKDALDAAVDSHAEAFPLSKCSKKCIRAQLESYYNVCKNSRPKMLDPQAKPIVPSSADRSGPI